METSGSGKSILLNILGAMDSPITGEIRLNGHYRKDIFKEPAATTYRRDNIGLIFEAFNLLKDLSVEENIALPLILKDTDDEIDTRVYHMLEQVDLTNWRRQAPSSRTIRRSATACNDWRGIDNNAAHCHGDT